MSPQDISLTANADILLPFLSASVELLSAELVKLVEFLGTSSSHVLLEWVEVKSTESENSFWGFERVSHEGRI